MPPSSSPPAGRARPVTGSVLFYVQHLLGIGHLRARCASSTRWRADGIAGDLGVGRRAAAGAGRRRGRADRAAGADPGARRELQGARRRRRPAGRRRPARGAARGAARRLCRGAARCRRDRGVSVRPARLPLRARPADRGGAPAPTPRAGAVLAARHRRRCPRMRRRRRDIVARVRADFDAVLVHGDPRLVPLEASFPEAPEIADRLVYTGYVGAPAEPPDVPPECGPGTGSGEVLVSAGGGAVGGLLLATALEARRRGCLADLPLAAAGRTQPAGGRVRGAGGGPSRRGCTRALPLRFSADAAALPGVGQPGRLQHRPRHSRRRRRRRAGAVRRSARDRADFARASGWPAAAASRWWRQASCRRSGSPRRSSARCAAGRRPSPSTPRRAAHRAAGRRHDRRPERARPVGLQNFIIPPGDYTIGKW